MAEAQVRPPAFGNGRGVDLVAVILRSHEAAPGVCVHAWLVVPAVPVSQLAGLAAHGLGQELWQSIFSHSTLQT